MMSKAILFRWELLALLILSLGLVACGDTASIPVDLPATITINTTQASPVQPIADVPSQPTGSYITSLQAKDFHFEIYEELPILRNYLGKWELQLTEQGHFSVSFSSQVMAEGEYHFAASQIFLSSSHWPSLCKNYQVPTTATYYWHLDGKALSLLGHADVCNIVGTALLFRELISLPLPPTLKAAS